MGEDEEMIKMKKGRKDEEKRGRRKGRRCGDAGEEEN